MRKPDNWTDEDMILWANRVAKDPCLKCKKKEFCKIYNRRPTAKRCLPYEDYGRYLVGIGLQRVCPICGTKHRRPGTAYCSHTCSVRAKRLRDSGKDIDSDGFGTKCDRTGCRMYNSKATTRCSALDSVDFGGKPCPFYKED